MLGNSHPHWYGVFGLRIASDLALPELQSIVHDDAPCDVEIVLGKVGAQLQDGEAVDSRTQLAPEAALVRVEGTASFHLWRGRRITIDVDPRAAVADVGFALLGVVFGVILVQRGLLALHGSSVACRDGAVAFMGPSGIGKSTLAVALQTRGYPLLCDDACVVDLRGSRPQTFAHGRLTKLCSDSIDVLGCRSSCIGSVHAGSNKQYVRLDGRQMAGNQGMPLLRIYALQAIPADGEAAISRVRGVASLALIARNVHGAALHRRASGPSQLLQRCLSLLNSVPLYVLPIRRELARIGDESARVVEHFEADEAVHCP